MESPVPLQIQEVIQAWAFGKVVIGPVLTAFGGLITCVGAGVIHYMRLIAENLAKLNEEQVRILTHLENHEKRIARLEIVGE
jgi:hypothetical protein